MSGIGGSEFLLLCVIGLLILGPERLPRVARQLGSWIGKARQMTRAMQRQLEEEIDMEKNLGINPRDFHPDALLTPREDDTYSPLHDEGTEDAKDTEVTEVTEDSSESLVETGDPDKRQEKSA